VDKYHSHIIAQISATKIDIDFFTFACLTARYMNFDEILRSGAWLKEQGIRFGGNPDHSPYPNFKD